MSGHATNVTVIGHLFGKNDLILHDEQIHNSALQGIALSGAKRRSFPHNDTDTLRELLTSNRKKYDQVAILVEGVYSMDGDLADLPVLVELKEEFDAILMVDEAHALGTVGKTGSGSAEHFGISAASVDIWMGTLSKALASSGGFIAGSTRLIFYLKYTTPGFFYSVGLSPADTAAATKSLEILRGIPDWSESYSRMPTFSGKWQSRRNSTSEEARTVLSFRS